MHTLVGEKSILHCIVLPQGPRSCGRGREGKSQSPHPHIKILAGKDAKSSLSKSIELLIASQIFTPSYDPSTAVLKVS